MHQPLGDESGQWRNGRAIGGNLREFGDREVVSVGKVPDVPAERPSNSPKPAFVVVTTAFVANRLYATLRKRNTSSSRRVTPTRTPTYESLRKAIMKRSFVLSSLLMFSASSALAQDALNRPWN
jgi:hypothetical protein